MDLARTTTAALAAALWTAATAGAETLSIEELAPENVLFVANVRHTDAVLQHLRQTQLWALWQSPEVKALRLDAHEKLQEDMGRMLEELGLEPEALAPPSGALGLAVFTVTNRELGLLEPACLVTAEYGDRAAKMAELLEAARALAEEQDNVEYEEQEVHGRTVRRFHFLAPAPEAGDGGDAAAGGGEGGADDGGPDLFADAFDTFFLVQEGTMFLLSSDMAALAGALEAIDGEAAHSLIEREDYRGVRDQIGEQDLTATLLMRDLGPFLSGQDPTGMTMMLAPLLKQLFGEVQGFGVGVRLDGPSAMIEVTESVYMPRGKAGLTALMTTPEPHGAVPGFVGPDAISFSTVNFDFSGLHRALLPVVQMMQMMVPPQPDGAPPVSAMLEQIGACLGRKMHVIQTLQRPIRSDSLRQVLAVECPRPRALEDLLGELGATTGLEGRDFLGHRIFTIHMPGGAMMAVPAGAVEAPVLAIGGGYVFAGPAPAVEQVLRSIGDAGNATLTDEPIFERAVGALGEGEAVAWGYSDPIASLEAATEVSRLQMAEALKALEAGDGPGPAGPGGGGGVLAILEKLMGGACTADLKPQNLRRYLGPMAWKANSTDEGFVAHVYLLDAGEQGER